MDRRRRWTSVRRSRRYQLLGNGRYSRCSVVYSVHSRKSQCEHLYCMFLYWKLGLMISNRNFSERKECIKNRTSNLKNRIFIQNFHYQLQSVRKLKKKSKTYWGISLKSVYKSCVGIVYEKELSIFPHLFLIFE